MFFEETQIKIIMDRDSICMQDDINSHEKEFIYEKGTTIKEFTDIIEKYYLPEIRGEWILHTKSGEKLFIYKQDIQEIEYAVSPDELIDNFYENGLFFCHKHYR